MSSLPNKVLRQPVRQIPVLVPPKARSPDTMSGTAIESSQSKHLGLSSESSRISDDGQNSLAARLCFLVASGGRCRRRWRSPPMHRVPGSSQRVAALVRRTRPVRVTQHVPRHLVEPVKLTALGNVADLAPGDDEYCSAVQITRVFHIGATPEVGVYLSVVPLEYRPVSGPLRWLVGSTCLTELVVPTLSLVTGFLGKGKGPFAPA